MDTNRRIDELERRVEELEEIVGKPFLGDRFYSISERVRRIEEGRSRY
ncbi:MAG: hypothetical protein OXU25_04020 [Thaumarchaeota archaeon]|nr:hypothetical protein [Nitrososphaerota archaeon]